ncbi:phage terminase large subunit family protein, partial [Escherichia coli 95.0183]
GKRKSANVRMLK